MDLIEMLSRPGREYTPIPFWFLNGDLTHGEIRRQLRDFCDHGVYGVVLHPRMGLSKRIGYLSPVFFRYLRTAVETAAELGMKIVLYDEGMYPSGSAGGLIVRERPDLASRGIALTQALQPGDTPLCETPQGTLAERFSRGTIRGLHYGEDDGEPNAPPSADILNPEAVARFLALTHEAYYREFAPWFGTVILGFFTDEPSILGRNAEGLMPWTKGFAEIFRAAGGRLSGLAGLFTGEENEDTALYHRLMLKREGEVYYASLSRWCEAHGIALMGHPHQSDDIEAQRYFHIPGQDLVFRWVSPEKGGTAGMDSVMAKCSADMARLMGRSRNANECFGACNRDGNPWHFTGGDMKWYIDWLTVRGVNLLIPHAFYYSLRGRRSAERPPDVGPGSIWWPHYRQWADYMARLCRLMAEGDLRADTAVLCKNRALPWRETAALYETQRGFQYLPESLWGECEEENGALLCRGRRFLAVLGEKEQFPSVNHDPAALAPDCLCDPPQPALRAARLVFASRDCWLLVNEGEAPLQTALTLPTHQPLGRFNLWEGVPARVESLDTAAGRQLRLCLDRRESALIFACAPDEADALPDTRPPARVLTHEDFTLIEENPLQHTKTYSAAVPPCAGDLLLTLEAEEMAELFVNGQFCAAAFWPPQRLPVPASFLTQPLNTLRLVITGSPANRYGRPVPYGIHLAP